MLRLPRFKRVVKVPHVAMVNLVAGKRIVPELIQGDFTPGNVVSHLEPLLHDEEARMRMQSDLARAGEMLQGEESAIDRVARVTSQMLHRNERLSPVS